MEAIFKKNEGIATWVLIGGQSLLDQTVASNAATFYVPYKPWEERGNAHSQDVILAELRRAFRSIQGAIVFAFPPPAIQGLGVSGGFQMQVEDRENLGVVALQQMIDEMIRDGGTQSSLRALNSPFRANVPQLYLDIDRVKAKSLDVPLSSLFNTLQAFLGSAYVNDFNKYGRTYQVRVQADQKFRLKPSDITKLEVRDLKGNMIPLGTMVKVTEVVGPQLIPRYNLYPTASITGEAAPGFSSGQALKVMEGMAENKLPRGMGYDWTGDVVSGNARRHESRLDFLDWRCSWCISSCAACMKAGSHRSR